MPILTNLENYLHKYVKILEAITNKWGEIIHVRYKKLRYLQEN